MVGGSILQLEGSPQPKLLLLLCCCSEPAASPRLPPDTHRSSWTDLLSTDFHGAIVWLAAAGFWQSVICVGWCCVFIEQEQLSGGGCVLIQGCGRRVWEA